jgi:hypothetical protein
MMHGTNVKQKKSIRFKKDANPKRAQVTRTLSTMPYIDMQIISYFCTYLQNKYVYIWILFFNVHFLTQKLLTHFSINL